METNYYWKAVKQNLTFSEAVGEYEDGVKYDGHRVAMRHNGRIINVNDNILSDEKFSVEEATSDKWELVIPDEEQNNELQDIREKMKSLNFTGYSYNKIDHCNMLNLWMLIQDRCVNENNAKDLIKFFIEKELYKKH